MLAAGCAMALLAVGCASGSSAGAAESSSASSSQGGRGRMPERLVAGRRVVAKPFVEGNALRIVAHNGEVRVAGVDRETLSVEGVLRLGSQERLDASQVVVETLGGETLVRAGWPSGGPQGAESSSFAVEAPLSARGVRVMTGTAPVLVEDVAGDCVVRAEGGSVVVRRQRGGVEVETVNARVEVVGARGDVRATTRNAPVRVIDTHGDVRISVEQGAALAAVAPEWAGRVELFATGGEAVVGLREDSAGTFELRSDLGRFQVDLPDSMTQIEQRSDGSWIVRVNGGGDAASVVESVGGTVRLALVGD